MKTDRKSEMDFEIKLEDNSLFIMGGVGSKILFTRNTKIRLVKQRYSQSKRISCLQNLILVFRVNNIFDLFHLINK